VVQLGFVLNVSMSCWEKRHVQLESYQPQVHGHCNDVLNAYIEIPGLGRWVARQLAEYQG
jgi:hypothetical protein